ncbi:uncharacterized protein B0P05DRAFT_529113 [Gilbertella persicaria]|uniref:uncharacterized protein n=1 Tax=Gilbertella persicaria TaxID=101096 RepID=UPI00221F398C|nr:uncharacterized protein B0P05DRAFT_529113 [Gilbertella persicaria]KAI8091167.1 hypothetical protein B0P05DRAFT_529113 [Gilbertella persicaria]
MRFSTNNPVSLTHSPNDFLSLSMPKKETAVTKQEDINRNLRNYYANTNSNKSQLTEDDSSLQKSNEERQTRHKAVKQYQEQSSEQQRHWKEYSNSSFVDINTYAPLKFKTHGYVRDTRSNSDCLRITAIKNQAQVVVHTKRPYLKKRRDPFEWGKSSPLRTEV